MLKIYLIRHGQTPGNKLSRYIGTTDESLSEEGRDFLEKLDYPMPDALYVSPLLRCVETAGILFPEKEMHIIEELSECDFGEFENKNYKELSGNENYQKWIDSNGTLPFPGGESRENFKRRSLKGFQKAVAQCIREEVNTAALVIHGGTIMNIMEEYGDRQRTFYEWHVKNGGGYQVTVDPSDWQKGRRELKVCEAYREG
ncbi:histidine phosphatase family protein [Blautia sp. CLA-JM-H16]|uniref:Histidine phosphatase family protein n=1 Tax=Blautia aquisgranensis TaxID=3133153 RepID=A0ABV1BAW5_9FIRM